MEDIWSPKVNVLYCPTQGLQGYHHHQMKHNTDLLKRMIGEQFINFITSACLNW